jgi:hypothetical protein
MPHLLCFFPKQEKYREISYQAALAIFFALLLSSLVPEIGRLTLNNMHFCYRFGMDGSVTFIHRVLHLGLG